VEESVVVLWSHLQLCYCTVTWGRGLILKVLSKEGEREGVLWAIPKSEG
jgi:hypothetical protein